MLALFDSIVCTVIKSRGASFLVPSHIILSVFPATRFGDKDLDLRLANPLHLRSVLEDKRFSKCCIVLLHASYPFSKEASYLASIYPQVEIFIFIIFLISKYEIWMIFDKAVSFLVYLCF